MSQKNNSFGDKDLGVDYDGKTLRQFNEEGKITLEEKMSYEEAYNYYQSLRSGSGLEQAELIENELEKICGILNQKLHSSKILGKYRPFDAYVSTPSRYDAEIDQNRKVITLVSYSHPGYESGGPDLAVEGGKVKIEGGMPLVMINFNTRGSGVLSNAELQYGEGEKGKYISIENFISIMERTIINDETKVKQPEIEKAVKDLLLADKDLGSKLVSIFPYPGVVAFRLKDVYRNTGEDVKDEVVGLLEMHCFRDGSINAVMLNPSYGELIRGKNLIMEEPDAWKNLGTWVGVELKENLKKVLAPGKEDEPE